MVDWKDVEMGEGDLDGEVDTQEDVSTPSNKQVVMVIPHSSGVFHHCVQFCNCPGSSENHIQLFTHGLFSASIKRPQTAFTFDVLDHFYVDAMECKTAAMSFFQKLRRFTNNAFPNTVPACPHSPFVYIGY
jgi:CxC2 like cysteine cluster associated with KDZ transposases